MECCYKSQVVMQPMHQSGLSVLQPQQLLCSRTLPLAQPSMPSGCALTTALPLQAALQLLLAEGPPWR